MTFGAVARALVIVTLGVVVVLVPAQSSRGGGTPPSRDCHPEGGHGCDPQGPRLLSYDEALAEGLPVSEIDASLSVCGPATSDGFGTIEEEEAEVDWNAEPTCQINPREAVYPQGVPARHTGYHHVGAETTAYAFHGVSGSIQATNPPVDHRRGHPYEQVLGRTLAAAPSGAWVEAGWGEFSYHADRPVVFACAYTSAGASACSDHTQSLPLTLDRYYQFRAFQCGPPGEMRVCADIYYGGWKRLGVYTNRLRCTNADGSGNCQGENLTEVYSDDSTPHPLLGPIYGMGWRQGRLRTDATTWNSWTTAYPITPTDAAPYIIEWDSLYNRFRACHTSCN